MTSGILFVTLIFFKAPSYGVMHVIALRAANGVV